MVSILKIICFSVLIGTTTSCSNKYNSGESYKVSVDTLYLNYGNSYGTVAHKRTQLNNGKLEFQFLNINNNCITSLDQDNKVTELCIPEYGPNHIDLVNFLKNGQHTFICGRDEAEIRDEDGKIIKKIRFSGHNILSDFERIRINDNLFFNSSTYYHKSRNAYFFLIKPNTLEGYDFSKIVAISFQDSELIPITVPLPENHNVSKFLAHSPSYSSMYFPYISICGDKIVLSYGLHNDIFFYELSQVDSLFGGKWNKSSYESGVNNSINLPPSGSSSIDIRKLEEIKNINYHYGPCKGNGDYIFQLYQNPNTVSDNSAPIYSCRVFDRNFTKILIDFELPKKMSYRSYSVINDKLYIELFQDDEDNITLLEYSIVL